MTVQLTLLCQPASAAMRAGVFPVADETHAAQGEPALREVDYGRWSGRSLKELADAEPDALARWLSDPDFDGHGGESIRALCLRIAQWFAAKDWPDGHTQVIVPANVVKACVLHVLQAPASAFWHLDIAPESTTVLSMRQGHWRVQL